ncbi:MAG: hypothetical protein CYG61_09930 [Actinobacteria bacterium]|nr:MAG: hypothetical protein CYG61_09930 [Actinomycetota bacterium]
MSDSFRRATGRKVVSRASAEEVGVVAHLLVDAGRHRVAAVVIGRGKKARLVDWAQLSSFGPDAVMVAEESALRPPADDREQAAADGKLELVGKRALTEQGNEMGRVEDVSFDPDSGALETLIVKDRHIPAEALLANGSYAAVLHPGQDEISGMRLSD